MAERGVGHSVYAAEKCHGIWANTSPEEERELCPESSKTVGEFLLA